MGESGLSGGQVALIRTLWEMAQGRMDALYDPEYAEQEKQAVEEWMKKVFPNDCDEFIRSESIRGKRAEEVY